MKEILESLESLGLSLKEGKVYLALLKLGQADVADIASEADIKRPTTYVILDELRKKGLVLKIPNAKKTLFQAKTPDELYQKAKSDIHRFERVLPTLRSLNPKREPIKTLYFEGLDGMKEALNYRINELSGSVITGFWAKNDNVSGGAMNLFNKWGEALEKKSIQISGFTPEHPSTEQYAVLYKDLRFAPLSDYSSDVSIEMTDLFVRIVDPHELKVVIIENPRIVDALKQIFKLAQDGVKESSKLV